MHSIMFVRSVVLLVAFLFVAGCDWTGGSNDSVAASGWKLKLPEAPDWKLKDPDIPDTKPCDTPKPNDIGCTTICKPCKTFVCNNGEWESVDIDSPDFICDPPSGPSAPDPFGCPRGGNGFCPAECSFCF